MARYRLFVVGTAITLLSLGAAQAQVRPGIAGAGALLPPDAVEKLKLMGDQKDKYANIEQAYKESYKALDTKMQDARKDADRAKVRELMTEAETLRKDTLSKVEGFLTADQKKVLDEVKQLRRPGPGAAPIRGGAPAVGQILPAAAQERLKLNDEQRKKVDELQKDLETKLLNLLTEEQKKQYEELKKGTPPARRPKQTEASRELKSAEIAAVWTATRRAGLTAYRSDRTAP